MFDPGEHSLDHRISFPYFAPVPEQSYKRRCRKQLYCLKYILFNVTEQKLQTMHLL